MSLLSEILGRRMRLIEPRQRAITHQPDLSVAADDGAMLLTDRWVATASLGRSQPTVLVRSPYGRRGIVGLMFGRLLAERGLQVVARACVARSAQAGRSPRLTSAPTGRPPCAGCASSPGTTAR